MMRFITLDAGSLHGNNNVFNFSVVSRIMKLIQSHCSTEEGSADTVVTAMNEVNGKHCFSGFVCWVLGFSTETLKPIFKEIVNRLRTLHYVGDTTHMQIFSVGVNQYKGACLQMLEVVAFRRQFFSF